MKLQAKAKACNFIKKETLAQVFSCEFAKFLRSLFFYKTATASAHAYDILYKSLRDLLRIFESFNFTDQEVNIL